ncbi:hypothetical protein PG991_009149 [Apiospora marii]|uniref:Uncharacterized protein n=1 Tax=Apiospora marii TaxID=335849 RepID=A0ABR1RJX1_9PEZI
MKFIPIKPASSPHRIVEKPLQNRRELVVKACNTCRMRKSKVNKPLQSSKRIVARTELRLVFWRPTDVDDKEEKGKKFEILSAFAEKLKVLSSQEAGQLLHKWRSSDGKIESLPKLLDVPTEPESVPASVSGPQVLTSREQTAFFVDAFFSTNDQLFHVFSRDQVEKYIHLCYDEDSQKQTADACCLSAVAAVGSQYRHEVVDKQLQPRRTFYDLARDHFESARDIQPSDAIKVSTMLCLYNITSSADEAARYAEKGLELYRKHTTALANDSPEMAELRRPWRALELANGTDAWEDAKMGVTHCLGVLEACSQLDPVAAQSYSQLSSTSRILDELRRRSNLMSFPAAEALTRPISAAMLSMLEIPNPPAPNYLRSLIELLGSVCDAYVKA